MCVFVCMSGECLVYPLVLCVCLSKHVYWVKRVVGGKRLTFPDSWGHLGHARG